MPASVQMKRNVTGDGTVTNTSGTATGPLRLMEMSHLGKHFEDAGCGSAHDADATMAGREAWARAGTRPSLSKHCITEPPLLDACTPCLTSPTGFALAKDVGIKLERQWEVRHK